MRDQGALHDLRAPEADRVAKLIEEAVDRVVDKLFVRLGAWTLAVVSIATAVLIAVLD